MNISSSYLWKYPQTDMKIYFESSEAKSLDLDEKNSDSRFFKGSILIDLIGSLEHGHHAWNRSVLNPISNNIIHISRRKEEINGWYTIDAITEEPIKTFKEENNVQN